MKLSSRKQLLSEADAELKRMCKLAGINTKDTLTEFGIKDKIHTVIEVDMKAAERYGGNMTTPLDRFISKSNINKIENDVTNTIEQFAKKNKGEFRRKVVEGLPVCVVEWGYEVDSYTFNKLYEELKNEVEKIFNPNLFEYYAEGYIYKADGMFGKGRVQSRYNDESFGNGVATLREYESFVEKLFDTHPAASFNRGEIIKSISKIMVNYFNNPKVLFDSTDWLPYMKSQTQKLFVNPKIRAKSL